MNDVKVDLIGALNSIYQADRSRPVGKVCKDAADTIESLRQQLADLKNIHNQTVSNGIAGFEAIKQQLAECQATNGKLRSDMSLFLDSHEECEDFDGFTAQIVSMDDYHKAQEALALPNDATALNELIAAAGEVMRERCIQAAENPMWRTDDDILSIPKLTSEDLK